MSDIEAAAQPILTAMIEDQPIVLNTEDQEKIAKWLGLKAIVHQYAVPIGRIAPAWGDAFAIKKSPPKSWCIRIARYQGTVPMFLGTHPFDATFIHKLLPFAVKRPAFLFTVQLDHFVGQVVGMQQETWVPPVRRFIQIWPHPLLRANSPTTTEIISVSWPPEGWLNDSDVKKCSNDPSEPKT